MSSVWISKESWDVVWNALHDIRINMSFTVKEPSALLTGDGQSSRLCFDLPRGDGFAAEEYDGMFQCSEDSQTVNGEVQYGIRVTEGILNVDGKNFSIASTFLPWDSSSPFYYILAVFNPDGWSIQGNVVYARIETRAYNGTLPDNSLIIGIVKSESGSITEVIQQMKNDFKIMRAGFYDGDFAVYPTATGIIIRSGYTDVGSFSNVSYTAAESYGKTLKLIGCSDGTSCWARLYFDDNVPTATYKSDPVIIAEISASGLPLQRWRGGTYYFNRLYLIGSELNDSGL